MRSLVLMSFLALSSPALAEEPVCPPGPDHSATIATLLDALKEAPDQSEARALTNELWLLWTDAPDSRAQALLDEGMAKRESYDFLGARETFDLLVEYCPDYAEGYNQRAFASFLRQDYPAALWDLEKTLDLSPDHMAALSGLALTLMGLGRNDEAQEVLRRAVDMNPWLNERHLLVEPEGTDI